MQITRADLYRLVIEEYAAEEGIVITEDKVDDLLAWVKGGEKPEWAGEDDGLVPDPPDVPQPSDRSDVTSSDTYPMDIPRDDAPESEYQGFQNDSGPEIESQLTALIQGMEPEEVSELFQSVFEKLPGVELSRPGDEDYPDEETLYSPGAEGRPVAGFQLQELMALIKEVMNENEWHDITAGETAPPHSYDAVESLELLQKIENAYHQLEEAFEELPDDVAQQMGRKIISDLQTLMDTTEYPEDYRE
jgi:hypothetical protein